MSFRISTTVRAAAATLTMMRHRALSHSPFTVLNNSPLTSPPKEDSLASAYEKHYDHPSEPVYHSGLRTYVVSEPDAHSKHYQVPAGAYPTSAPYINFDPTSAPDTTGRQFSSTAAGLAHETTTAAAPRNTSGVGESAAVRNASAPGVLGMRGGGYGGLGLMDKQGTTSTERLADRNPPPDGNAAEKYSKAGVREAWKLRK